MCIWNPSRGVTGAKIIRRKTALLDLAEELGNVSTAGQVMGMSRDTFYYHKSAVEDGAVDTPLGNEGSNLLCAARHPASLQEFFLDIRHVETQLFQSILKIVGQKRHT